MKNLRTRIWTSPEAIGALALAAMLALPAASLAKSVDSCADSPIDENSTLSASFTWTGTTGECLFVMDGYDLDFNGKTITCSPSSGTTCSPAVLCNSSGVDSIIQDSSGGSATANLSGAFTTGVHNCGTVKNMKIVGAQNGIVSTLNGKDYFQNVIQPAAGGTAIDVLLQDGLDRIYDNRIDGGAVGIEIVGKSSATGPKIDNNVIRDSTTVGILNSDSTHFRIEDNTIVEGARAFNVLSTNASFSDNICEEDISAGSGRCSCELDRLMPPVNCF